MDTKKNEGDPASALFMQSRLLPIGSLVVKPMTKENRPRIQARIDKLVAEIEATEAARADRPVIVGMATPERQGSAPQATADSPALVDARRVIALRKWAEADPGNEELARIVRDAIDSGKTVADVWSAMSAAIRDRPRAPGEDAELSRIARLCGLSREDLKKYGDRKPAPVPPGWNAEQVAMCRKTGLRPEELARYAGASPDEIIRKRLDSRYRR